MSVRAAARQNRLPLTDSTNHFSDVDARWQFFLLTTDYYSCSKTNTIYFGNY